MRNMQQQESAQAHSAILDSTRLAEAHELDSQARRVINTLRQAVHTWYQLSCGCTARQLVRARGNTTECVWHTSNGIPRVFILKTNYEKPINDD